MNTKNLKPFDLEAALKGEPVMMRNGKKAFVRHHEAEQPVGTSWSLWGVVSDYDGTVALTTWSKDGAYAIDGGIDGFDIIGMYPKTRIINGFEVPAPEVITRKADSDYWTVDFTSKEMCVKYHWCYSQADLALLSRGLVFLNDEDAIANAKAMLGIDPHEEGEE